MSEPKCGCRIGMIKASRNPCRDDEDKSVIIHCPRHSEETAKERDRIKEEVQKAREVLIEADPLMFDSNGEIDHEKPLLAVAEHVAATIANLRKLYSEIVEADLKREVRVPQRDVMLAMLRRLEWVKGKCICCGGLKMFGGHAPDCELASLLAAAEGR